MGGAYLPSGRLMTPWGPKTTTESVLAEVRGAHRLGAVLEGTPAAHPVVAQLEEPGHLVLAGGRAVFVPVPVASDQRHCRASAALGPVLVELLQLDRLLHPARGPRRPEPRRLDPLAHPLHRMQFHLGVQDLDERIQVPLVERADELTDGV